jgi:Rrf2 family protein
MAKVLQKLAKGGLVAARHGSSGGYVLARDAAHISALDVIRAIDGPLFITSCVTSHGTCDLTTTCSIREPLRRVNDSILEVLEAVKISHMTDESPLHEVVELRV